MTDSRRKGATGERELSAAMHNAIGVRLLRQLDQSRAGGFDLAPEPGDDSGGARRLRQFAVEVKRHRTATVGDIKAWWLQTARLADADALLAYRADRHLWRVMIRLHHLAPGTVPRTVTLTLEAFAASTPTNRAPRRRTALGEPSAGNRTGRRSEIARGAAGRVA